MTKYDGMDWIYISWLFYFSLQKWKLYYLKFPFLCWYGRIYLFDLFIYFAIKTVLQEDYLTLWGRFLFSDVDKNVSQKTHVVVKASEAGTECGGNKILFWTGVSFVIWGDICDFFSKFSRNQDSRQWLAMILFWTGVSNACPPHFLAFDVIANESLW